MGLLSAAAYGAADAVRVGDERAHVYDLLGQPRGYMAYGTTEVLSYERGRVELKDGRVTSVSLISEAELARRRAEEERRRIAEQERLALLLVEGTALRDRKLNDTVFTSAPAAERVAYWRTFRQRYPGVNISEPYTLALREFEAELAVQTRQNETQRQLAELERRVNEAEARARAAEEEARRRSSSTYFVGYSGYPAISTYRHGYHAKPYYSHHKPHYSSHSAKKSCSTSPRGTYTVPSYFRYTTPGVMYSRSSGYAGCARPSYGSSSYVRASISF